MSIWKPFIKGSKNSLLKFLAPPKIKFELYSSNWAKFCHKDGVLLGVAFHPRSNWVHKLLKHVMNMSQI